MAKLLNSGRNKIALQQGNSLPLDVTTFIFANIPGLNADTEVDKAQGMPSPAHIVYQQAKTKHGYVANDKVVYSIILAPDVGDFSFNWVGIVDADNTLIAVTYTPVQVKYKTVGLTIGNTLTRNFLLQFNDAQATTGITIPAEAWQIDFIGRLNSSDEALRVDMNDIFGAGFFIGDGFKISAVGNVVSAKAGVGFVGGYRVVLDADTVITTGVLPRDIYVDAMLNADVSGAVVSATFKTSTAAVPLSNYIDLLDKQHYVVKIASVSAAYAVTDLRKYMPSNVAVIEYLMSQLALKAPLESPALTGVATVPTPAAGNNSKQISNTEFVQALVSALVDSSPSTLNTLKKFATALGNDPNFSTSMANALAVKAPLASPVFTGNPTVPTPAAGNNSKQISNTEFVLAVVSALVDSSPSTLNTLKKLATALGNDPNFATSMANALAAKAPLASPVFTGNPTVPTPAAGNNTKQIANTEFTQALIAALATVARTGSAADLTGTLAAAQLPFNYSFGIFGGYVAQRDANGNLYVPDSPINEASAKAASMNTAIQLVNAAIANQAVRRNAGTTLVHSGSASSVYLPDYGFYVVGTNAPSGPNGWGGNYALIYRGQQSSQTVFAISNGNYYVVSVSGTNGNIRAYSVNASTNAETAITINLVFKIS